MGCASSTALLNHSDGRPWSCRMEFCPGRAAAPIPLGCYLTPSFQHMPCCHYSSVGSLTSFSVSARVSASLLHFRLPEVPPAECPAHLANTRTRVFASKGFSNRVSRTDISSNLKSKLAARYPLNKDTYDDIVFAANGAPTCLDDVECK